MKEEDNIQDPEPQEAHFGHSDGFKMSELFPDDVDPKYCTMYVCALHQRQKDLIAKGAYKAKTCGNDKCKLLHRVIGITDPEKWQLMMDSCKSK